MKRFANGRYYILAASVALLTLLVYLPALQNQFVVEWDDSNYVSANPLIRSLDATFVKCVFLQFHASNWHPLTWISHALDYALWGLNPMGHHLTSIVLHALNTFLVVMLVIRLLDAYRKREARRGQLLLMDDRTTLIVAAVTGLLFGLHPLHVESVVWVAERKDIQSALFFLMSIMAYARYADDVSDKAQRAERIAPMPRAGRFAFCTNKHCLMTFGFFVLALLSKPMAVTLPIVLLLLDWHPFGRIRSFKTFRDACVEKLPFILLSIASSIVTVCAQKAGGALSSSTITPFATRVLVAAKALIAYLGKMLLPVNLVPFYPYPETASFASFEYFAPVALVVGITAFCMLHAERRKLWLAAWGYYCITLLPVLGIIQVGRQSMADRYTYLPSLGPFLAAGLGAACIWERICMLKRPVPFVKLFIGVAAACMIIILSAATIEQTGIWKNSLTLWTYVIKKSPAVSLAYNNRGLTYDSMGMFDEAVADFDKAIKLAPSDHQAYSNRGMLFGKTGRFNKAIKDFKTAIALAPSHPAAYNNLGIAYAKTGSVDNAIEQFNKTILIDPGQAKAYYNRGLLYSRTGNDARAVSDYRKACTLGNNNACNALQAQSSR